MQGAEQLITKHRPVIYLENDDPEASGPLLELLQGHGYRAFWHRSALFNANNHKGHSENIFGAARCVNIIALPGDTTVQNMTEATDASTHPKLRGM